MALCLWRSRAVNQPANVSANLIIALDDVRKLVSLSVVGLHLLAHPFVSEVCDCKESETMIAASTELRRSLFLTFLSWQRSSLLVIHMESASARISVASLMAPRRKVQRSLLLTVCLRQAPCMKSASARKTVAAPMATSGEVQRTFFLTVCL